MTALPRGWTIGQLSEICHIEMGQSPPSRTYNTDGVGLPFLQGKGEFGELYPTPTKYCSSPSKIGRVGAVLLSVRAPVGPTNIASRECCIGRGLAAISPLGGISARFILWALRNHEPTLAKAGSGSTFSAVSKAQVVSIPIACPSLKEQRRIVERIEYLFDEIDRGVASLRDAKRTIGLYRQSLLRSAFEGRLTARWRAKNPDKLETPDVPLVHLESNRTPWPSVHVQALLDAPLVNGRSVKEKEGGFPVLRLTALKGGEIDLRQSKEGDWREDEAEPFLVKRSDVFVSRGNGSRKLVGIGGRVAHDPMPVAFPDTMIRIRLDTNAVRPEYFVLAWNSWTVRQQIEMAARTTAGIYKINQGHIRGFVLPLPSLAEQSEIVRVLQERLGAIDALHEETDANLARAEALRQSILKSAFSGELVPQNPDDEPAQALLARIRASRDGNSSTKPGRRARRRGRAATSS